MGNESSDTAPLLERILDRILRAHQVADQKAGLLFAASIALLGAIGGTASRPQSEIAVAVAFWYAAAAATVVSIGFQAAGAFPRTRADRHSLLYFGTIPNVTLPDYIKAVKSISEEDLISDLAHQVYRNSKIALTKFACLKVSWWIFVGGGITWFLYLWVSK